MTNINKLLRDRYLLDSEKTWDDLAERVSGIYPQAKQLIKDMVFVPGSPILMNACTKERVGTLSSCFPLDIKDSMEDIMDAMKNAAMVTKMCGGVGYDFSTLRSAREVVKSTGRVSGGIMGFAGILNAVLDGVRQGSARRGAGMILLNIYHPDILSFIDAKKDLKQYNRVNLSIKIDSDFYDVLDKNPNKLFMVRYVTSDTREHLVDDKGEKYTYKMIWDKIVESAWTMAEPGIVNESYILERSTLQHIGNQALTNPCQEFCTTVPNISCNLGSIDLAKLVEHKKFDWERFGKIIPIATRFLNNVIDANKFPIPAIKEATLNARPIGVGTMGLANALYKMYIPYDSKQAKQFTHDVIKYLTLKSMEESVLLAKENGKSYPWFDVNIFFKANKRFFEDETQFKDIDIKELKKNIKTIGIRNSSQTSIAPTGSISTIANTSSGIEPVFGLVYTRKVEKQNKQYELMYIVDPVFQHHVESYHKDESTEIFEYISKNNGSCKGCKNLTKEEQEVFKVAGDIAPEDHIEILEAVANNVSLSVSKTTNLPKNATKEEVSKIYKLAHSKGIIGVTVYRDGCREGILVHNEEEPEFIKRREAPKRPESLNCDIHVLTIKEKKTAVLVSKMNGSLYEIFVANVDTDILEKYENGIIKKIKRNHYALLVMEDNKEKTIIENLGKTFGDAVFRTLARFISMSLRHGVPLKFIVEQLNKSDDFTSFDKTVSRILKKYIKNGEVYEAEKCPLCGEKLYYYDGCISCRCGWSKCG